MKPVQPPSPPTAAAPNLNNKRPRRRPDLTLPLPKHEQETAAILPLPPSSATQIISDRKEQPFSLYELVRLNRIGRGSESTVYKVLYRPTGRLFALKIIYGNHPDDVRRNIHREIEILRGIDDLNVVKCHGMFDDTGKIQILLEYMDGGSLEGLRISHEASLADLSRQFLSGICYLHRRKIVHRDIKPSNLLTNSEKEFKIADFGVSRILFDPMDPCNSAMGTLAYMSPERIDTAVSHGTVDGYAGDIWSLGVCILELYLGRFPFAVNSEGDWASLMCAICLEEPPEAPATASGEFRDFVSCCLQKDPSTRWTAEQLLEHPFIIQDAQSVKPNMVQDDCYKINRLEYWKIPLKEIHLATNYFHVKNLIGRGGFGGVYKAELFHLDVKNFDVNNEPDNISIVKRSLNKVAIKKLDSRYGQGPKEFLQEIKVLSSLRHQNLLPLVGFCDEDNEMILVYEYASNGSLDKCIMQRVYSHSWAQRIQICLDVAHALGYLHDNGIIHRDIKSANILLGRNWEGMIGDFGLSRISVHADPEFTMTNVVGTAAYVDPNYARTGKLNKQSDIYSFGVVLLEVFCGRLAVFPKLGDDPEYLLHVFKRHFLQRTVDQVLDPYVVEEFKNGSPIPDTLLSSMNTFADITYKCLYNNQAQDLTMAGVIAELKKALTFHVSDPR